MGYPVIDVYRDEKDKETAVVTQEHFVTDVKDEEGKSNQIFEVYPIRGVNNSLEISGNP